ncbi:AzlD domain-containing protein [Pseudomonas sp. NPDC007930]|uniref:AzlD domain-containing protein n=1 Tax=Pseudomonas sp. NPDC007930 TaxID=3364417 RepID=UPI0036E69604
MNEPWVWGLFVAVGLGTFALRLSFVELHGRWRPPPVLQRALAYVPASVLAALVLPAVVYPGGHAAFSWANPQLPAALVATAVAWYTRSTLLPLVAGMLTLWGLMFILG